MMKIKVVLFDFIGTVVKEKTPGLIAQCLSDAFADHGFFISHEQLRYEQGKGTLSIIKGVLDRYSLSLSMAPGIYRSFKKNIEKNIENLCASDDILFVFSYLLRVGISVGIRTGLPGEIFDLIISRLGWTKRSFSYIGFLDEIGTSRPGPGMIFDMMSKLNIRLPQEVVKVGDTVADIQEGKNAGCLTAVILSGTQSQKELMKERPNYILRSLSDVKWIISESMSSDHKTSKCRFV